MWCCALAALALGDLQGAVPNCAMDDEPELPCTPLFEQGGRGGEGGDCHGGPPGPVSCYWLQSCAGPAVAR